MSFHISQISDSLFALLSAHTLKQPIGILKNEPENQGEPVRAS